MSEPMNEAKASFCIHRVDEMACVRQWIKEALDSHHYSGHDLFAVRLAFEEAATNAIMHGNGGDAAKSVNVDVTVNEAKVEMTIRDEGCGFDYTHLEDCTADKNLLRDCGRGVMLIRCFVDEMRFNEAGNCMHLVKYRSAPTPS